MTKSLIGSLGALWPDSPVLMDDHSWAERGTQGWTQLHDSTNGWFGPVGLEPLGHGGGLYPTLRAKNGTLSRERDVTAIKRINNIASVYDLEVWWAWRSLYGQNGLRAFSVGLDNADAVGNRYFHKFRWAHYSSDNRDGSGAWTRTNKLQVVDADGLPTDLPSSPTYPGAQNENKADMNYFKGRFDVGRGLYLGCQWGPDGYGCFAANAAAGQAAFEAAFAAPPSSVPTFAYGLNPTIESFGRIDTSATESTVQFDRVRLSVVA